MPFLNFPDTTVIQRRVESNDTFGGVTYGSPTTVNSAYMCRLSQLTDRDVRHLLNRKESGYDFSKLRKAVGDVDSNIQLGDILVDGSETWRVLRISPKRRVSGPNLFQVMLLEEAN